MFAEVCMKRLGWLFLALVTAAQQSLAAPSTLASRVDEYVAPFVAGNNFSGCVLIPRKESTLVNRCYGMANQEFQVTNSPETRFHIASISKPFTAALILLLEERGQLLIDDPLDKYF